MVDEALKVDDCDCHPEFLPPSKFFPYLSCCWINVAFLNFHALTFVQASLIFAFVLFYFITFLCEKTLNIYLKSVLSCFILLNKFNFGNPYRRNRKGGWSLSSSAAWFPLGQCLSALISLPITSPWPRRFFRLFSPPICPLPTDTVYLFVSCVYICALFIKNVRFFSSPKNWFLLCWGWCCEWML